ncbi:MAG: aldehyde dehydrogenase [Thaumarchaeota archaeon]|nr:aldehyde dehydrogenase [Nitrososphaerota archaeon]
MLTCRLSPSSNSPRASGFYRIRGFVNIPLPAKSEAQRSREIKRYGLYVGGKWVDAEPGRLIPVVNPYTGEVWAEIAEASAAQVNMAVTAARRAFDDPGWRQMKPSWRGRLMWKFGEMLEKNADELARLETMCNGKVIRETRAQMGSFSSWFYYFGGLADKIQGEVVPVEMEGIFTYTLREPLGVVAVVAPWNSPLLISVYSLAPAIAAGNTVVLKPSSFAPVSVLRFASLFEEAGFPPGVVNVVTGSGSTAGDALVGHPVVAKVAFTGGTSSGKSVASRAADHLVPTTLELGGKSPNIVFDDADLAHAVDGIVAGIFSAAGQSCVAGSRALVQEGVYEDVVSRLVDRTSRLKLGDPLDEETEVGPLASKDQLTKVSSYIELGKKEGVLLWGGGRPESPALRRGFFVQPTVFKTDNRSRIAREEVFGPVLSLITFQNEDEAVQIANDTEFGLAAGIWTRDLGRAHRVARALQAGTVWINTYRTISYSVPFGGYKQSGYGRENGMDAMREFLQTKSVWVQHTGSMRDPFAMRS